MVAPTTPPKNAFNAYARKVYNPLGFSKAYNFILWFTFAGALFGFSLSRFMYLNFNTFCHGPPGTGAAPGECYYYVNFTRERIGILLHLATVLPSGLIACLQFTPFIRHKWIIVHRIGGYASLLLYFIGLAGALMIARHAFGGAIETQTAVFALAIMTTISFVLAYVNVKRLQIEQHRAWMLRGWFYASCIITNRLILVLSAQIISRVGSYYTSWPCAKLAFTIKDDVKTAELYPECASYFNGSDLLKQASVHANFGDDGTGAEVGAAFNMTFGMALWLALLLHAVGVEIYLHLTPRETERLRNVSYQRQLEAGMKKPGSGGLTSDRLGDSYQWVPLTSRKSSEGQ
ncbi:hypothetical protein DM02DRAFT_282318 [Periconia macrospinosa]|uniref:DUF2306 domain-containing protein n=1 Tax=Periconia macrospinosa TaxID=97972 RepID=A0A2V1D497_9PLEO|nr:hypothetical protein DM02DRAFT_282318 [Periconia macrospinosa]